MEQKSVRFLRLLAVVTIFCLICFSTAKYASAAALNNDLAWSPDGTIIAISDGPFGCTATAGSHVVILFNATTNEEIGRLSGNLCPILSVAWSSDSQHLATGSEDGEIQI